jgi:hypothetical protein
MIALWYIASCCLVEIGRRFRVDYSLHYQREVILSYEENYCSSFLLELLGCLLVCPASELIL